MAVYLIKFPISDVLGESVASRGFRDRFKTTSWRFYFPSLFFPLGDSARSVETEEYIFCSRGCWVVNLVPREATLLFRIANFDTFPSPLNMSKLWEALRFVSRPDFWRMALFWTWFLLLSYIKLLLPTLFAPNSRRHSRCSPQTASSPPFKPICIITGVSPQLLIRIFFLNIYIFSFIL